uniref:EGF-like domain-containing protein n=1 Tax=Oryza glaberrima TaxID=4538 RepID=I1QUK4_ORYGL
MAAAGGCLLLLLGVVATVAAGECNDDEELARRPCVAVNCGPGGQCVKEEGFSYHCACSPGFVNMLNLTELPCIKNCAFGKDCAALGLSPASTPAPAPTPAELVKLDDFDQSQNVLCPETERVDNTIKFG